MHSLVLLEQCRKSFRAGSLLSFYSIPKSLFRSVFPKHYSTFCFEKSMQFSRQKCGRLFCGIFNCDKSPLKFPLTARRGIAGKETVKEVNRKYALYVITGVCLSLGVAYASAPLYKVFCQTAHIGGELNISLREEKAEKLESIEPVKDFGEITVQFQSSRNSRMLWEFVPQQESVRVYPGETALAFFTATNPTDRPIVGVSTYNVIPYDAAPYFNKIQCFCFEEQRLEPNETVDMPVFFYIDPEIVRDHRCGGVKKIILGYTFFEAKGDFVVPEANNPGIAKNFEKQY